MEIKKVFTIVLFMISVSLSQSIFAQAVNGFCFLGYFVPKYAVTQPEPTLRTEWGHEPPFSTQVVYNQLDTRMYLGATVGGGVLIDQITEQGGYAPTGQIFDHRVIDIPYPNTFTIEGIGRYSFLAVFGQESTIIDIVPVECDLASFLTYP